MKTQLKVFAVLAGAVACLLLGGCTTAEMKGTPFYSGEFSGRHGPAEQRVNAWPIFYFRDPALSVLWPILESTDDHFAVRPLFSVYGLDKTNRDYSFFWPVTEFNLQTHDHHIFPAFWGDDYRVLFPLYWHEGDLSATNGGTDSLFPFWIVQRDATTNSSLWAPWPLFHSWQESRDSEHGSMVFPIYWREQSDRGSMFVSLPWFSGSNSNGFNWQLLTPLYYRESDRVHSAIVTPLWAQGHSESRDWKALPLVYWDRQADTLLSPLWAHWKNNDGDTYFAPWLFSWEERCPKRNDLWLAAGLAHANWGTNGGSHYAFPFYYRDAKEHELLTPFFGWDKGDDGFIYPFTPLVGEWTGRYTGNWVFPLYSHSKDTKTVDDSDSFLLFGGHSTSKYQKETWFFPLFSYTDNGPLDTSPESERRYAIYGKDFLCFPWCWYLNQVSIQPAKANPLSASAKADTNAPLVRTFEFKDGAFPLWSYERKSTPAENFDHTHGSVLLRLYDYKHEIDPASKKSQAETNDYTRARVLWRVWHYERLNGDVSVDAFPTFTYDHKTDGFKKTSLLWHLFRYEHSAAGDRKLDLLFIPVLRQSS